MAGCWDFFRSYDLKDEKSSCYLHINMTRENRKTYREQQLFFCSDSLKCML